LARGLRLSTACMPAPEPAVRRRVAIGSLTWVSMLATGVALAGRSMSKRAIRITDGVAGGGLIGFGGVLAYTTLVAPAGIEPAHKV
jgi:hypothetical protein